MLNKLLLIIVLNLFFSSTVHAVPASPDPLEIQQPDGSSIRARIHGDELQNWTEAEDTGHTILHNKLSGFWEYAEQNKDGTLRPNGIRVLPKGLNAPAGLFKGLRPPRNMDNERHMKHRFHVTEQSQVVGSSSSSQSADDSGVVSAPAVWNSTPVSGTKKLLVVLVSFIDTPLHTAPANWYSAVFDESAKSVAKFYKDNSFSTMKVIPVTHSQPGNPAGVVSVTLSSNHPNTGGNYTFASDQAWGNSALVLAASYVNFNSLDSNGDGKIDTSEAVIYFIVAGYDASGSSKTPSVWAHAWSTTGTGLAVGSKNIQRWAQNGELNDSNVQHPMGVMAHELGHQLCGLPDLYDISSFNAGLGNFSIMAGGSWGRDYYESYGGMTPTSLDAWSREFLGWSTPLVPNMSSPVSPFNFGYQLASTSTPYKLILPLTSSSEYFLLENRWPTGWDVGLRGMSGFGSGWQGGLLVLHIDNNAGPDINDHTNTANRQGVIPVQASTATCDMLASGTSLSCRGNSKTLFYSGNNTVWAPASFPNSNYYNGALTNFYLTAVSAPNSTMLAEFSYGPPGVPGAPNMGLATRGNGQASVSFSPPANDGGSAITGYSVTSSPGGFTGLGSVSPITVTGLTNGTGYTFTVNAINNNGIGGLSTGSNSVTPATTPGSPTTISAVRGNAQALVSFTAPAFDGGSVITNYTVTSFPGGFIGMGDSSPVTVVGLINGTSYTFNVTATNNVGISAPSTVSNIVTPATVPGAPSIGSVKFGSGQAAVSFEVPASDGGSIITGYTVTSDGGQYATSTMSPITVTGLTDGSEYTFTVAATNSVGSGTNSLFSGSVTPGVVHNSGFDSKGYLTLQSAYNADTHTPEIQIIAGASVGSFLKNDSDTVTIKGGYDTAFSTNSGAPAILSSIVLKNGTTRFEKIVVRSP